MAYIFDLSDAWAGGAAFTAIKMNVTDGGSTAGSLLMDLQVGGVSRFSVSKGGNIRLGSSATKSAPNFAVSSDTGLYVTGSIFGYTSGNYAVVEYNAGWKIYSGGNLGFTSGEANAALDTILARDAANTLAQRNGVNAQAFNLYNTYTDASNYERGFMRFVSNVLEVGTEKLGTGGNRGVRITSPNVASISVGTTYNQIDISTGLTVFNGFNGISLTQGGISATGSEARFDLAEVTAPVAPSANRVRIYAEDDGAGKTRLMARFATGAAVQIAIEP